MSRFSTPEDVRVAAEDFAADLYRRHRETGQALNPYCTPSAIDEFARGFNGTPRRSWEGPMEWDFRYLTGAAVRRLVDKDDTNAKDRTHSAQ